MVSAVLAVLAVAAVELVHVSKGSGDFFIERGRCPDMQIQ